jgi:DNA mismatch endonuclease (patch repair protein)
MDVLTAEQRSYNMSRIRSEDTKPELTVRKWLWHHGYRYRLHRKNLPGKPDIVLPKYHAVIFVHGCFWHRHGCKLTSSPATRKEFWETKFRGNIERDKKNIQQLDDLGWHSLIIWECEIRTWDTALEIKIQNFLHSCVSKDYGEPDTEVSVYNRNPQSIYDGIIAAESEPDFFPGKNE